MRKQIKQIRQINYKKLVIICLLTAGLSILIWLLSWKNAPEFAPYQLINSVSAVSENRTEIAEALNGEDITIPENTRSLELLFGNELTRKTEIDINAFYLNQENQIQSIPLALISLKGQSSAMFDLPENRYQYIEVSINETSDLKLTDIRTSALPISVQAHVAIKKSAKNLPLSLLFVSLIVVSIYHCRKSFFRLVRFIAQNTRRVWIKITAALLIVSVAELLYFCILHLFHRNWNLYQAFFVLGIAAPACFIVLWKDHLSGHFTVFYIVTALCLGTMLSFMLRVNLYNCPDDWTHYPNILAMSYGGEAFLTEADQSVINVEDKSPYGNNEHFGEYQDKLDQLYRNGARNTAGYSVTLINLLGYLPEAFGLMLGRALNLPFHGIFCFGRYCGLLFYIFVTAAAIHVLPEGRLLAATVFLLPSILYQACNFTYDGWIISLLGLAVCLYLSILYSRDKYMTIPDGFQILVLFLLGGIVKVIYLPLTALLLYVPGRRFADRKSKKHYYTFLIGLILLAALAVLCYIVFHVEIITDTRGGENHNGPAQLAFLLAHPTGFLRLLRWTFTDLLSGSKMTELLTWIFVLGTGGEEPHGMVGEQLWALLLLSAVFTEGGKEDYNLTLTIPEEIGFKIVAGLLSLFCIYGAVLAMYVAYTAVGADSVGGCQPRYVLPALLPALYSLRFERVINRYNQNSWLAVHMVLALAGYALGLAPYIAMFQ